MKLEKMNEKIIDQLAILVRSITFHPGGVSIKIEGVDACDYLARLPEDDYLSLLDSYDSLSDPSRGMTYAISEIKRYREYWSRKGG